MKKLYCLCITIIVVTLIFSIGPRLFPERKSSLKQKLSISYKDHLKINFESEEKGIGKEEKEIYKKLKEVPEPLLEENEDCSIKPVEKNNLFPRFWEICF